MPNHTNSRKVLLFRHAILLQLEAASPASLPLETLQQGLCLAGHPADESRLLRELDYLKDKEMLASRKPELSHGTPRFRLTAQGRDYLEGQGLA